MFKSYVVGTMPSCVQSCLPVSAQNACTARIMSSVDQRNGVLLSLIQVLQSATIFTPVHVRQHAEPEIVACL
jgi:hypothetical protein